MGYFVGKIDTYMDQIKGGDGKSSSRYVPVYIKESMDFSNIDQLLLMSQDAGKWVIYTDTDKNVLPGNVMVGFTQIEDSSGEYVPEAERDNYDELYAVTYYVSISKTAPITVSDLLEAGIKTQIQQGTISLEVDNH